MTKHIYKEPVAEVYCITQESTGLKYYGSTGNGFLNRAKAHLGGCSNSPINKTIRKGALIEDFYCELVLIGSPGYCQEMEKRLIEAYSLYPKGFNRTIDTNCRGE